MKVIKIDYPTPLDKIDDLENDNIDVFVELEDGNTYTLVIATPKNLYWYMDKEGLDYIPAHPPDIIVRALTHENIKQAIENYADGDAYWLKLYYLSGEREEAFDIRFMDSMIQKNREENSGL